MGTMPAPVRSVTDILQRVRAGDASAQAELLPLVYDRLRLIAARLVRGERAGHTLEPTELVHEAFLRLVGPDASGAIGWNDRTHFFAVAATAMRRILVSHARAKRARKRGSDWRRISVGRLAAASDRSDWDVLDIHQALEALAALSERQARIAELRFFAGLTVEEAAEALAISPRTVELDWRMAKTFLAGRLRGDSERAS